MTGGPISNNDCGIFGSRVGTHGIASKGVSFTDIANGTSRGARNFTVIEAQPYSFGTVTRSYDDDQMKENQNSTNIIPEDTGKKFTEAQYAPLKRNTHVTDEEFFSCYK